MLSGMPRFNAARRYGSILAVLGGAFAVLGFLLLTRASGPMLNSWLDGLPIPLSLAYLGAALWLASAGFLSAALMSFARRQHLKAESAWKDQSSKSDRVTASAAKRDKWRLAAASLVARLESWIPDLGSLADWPQALLPLVFASFAAVRIVSLWRLPPETPLTPVAAQLLAGGLVLCAFPLLVLERIYANIDPELLPEGPQINRLLRVPLTACVGFAVAIIMMSAGFGWAAQLVSAIAILIFVMALELVARSAVTLFVPFLPIEQARSVADSSIAGFLLRLSLPNFRAINITVRRQFGIDLSRSWALAFVQRAALPILVGIGIFAWCVTGVTALSVNQRGVYQRLGRPVAVFAPGLHVHLPWPLGIVRPVEIGVVHQLPIEFLLPNGNGNAQADAEPPEARVGAEAPPPASADRLWDDAHPFEGSYLIASEENGQQGFQLTDVDMAVIYQVGLSDEAATNAAYRITDTDELIQALSGQLLVRYLSKNTLLNLLGQSRENFSNDFRTALQKQLDDFSAGIEVLAISIEAIHPPPGAASAYHDVQAAEIRANAQISQSRGEAARSQKFAELQANGDHNKALAAASELVGEARTASVLFGGDRQASGRNANAFLLERWFDNLSKALAKSEFVVIDHRLNGQDVPTLDLRNMTVLAPNQNLPLPSPSARPPEGQPLPDDETLRDDDGD